jgi:hypothetical protein
MELFTLYYIFCILYIIGKEYENFKTGETELIGLVMVIIVSPILVPISLGNKSN